MAPSAQPPVFKTWFTAAQRAWLEDRTDGYRAALEAKDTVRFVRAITEQFLATYPLRHTRKWDKMSYENRLSIVRIRVRAFLVFAVIQVA
ncbi:hypothetical protein MD484_g1364, partial [Candolleomyces efflorescens]